MNTFIDPPFLHGLSFVLLADELHQNQVSLAHSPAPSADFSGRPSLVFPRITMWSRLFVFYALGHFLQPAKGLMLLLC